MTLSQKNEIIRLRESGKTYAAIAEIYSLSVNTVQSICRRAAEAEKRKLNPSPKCENCRKPMKESSQSARRFCCDECRYNWWAKNANKRPGKEVVCAQCKKSFTYQGSRPRKFCSRKCYGHSKATRAGLAVAK